jgi:hypothetical protein
LNSTSNSVDALIGATKSPAQAITFTLFNQLSGQAQGVGCFERKKEKNRSGWRKRKEIERDEAMGESGS